MQDLVYIGNVDESGMLKIVHRSEFDRDMSMFAGKRLRIAIRPVKKTRSIKQNRYYWGCVLNFVLQGLWDAGYPKHEVDIDTVHEFLKSKFLKKDLVSEDTGEVINVTRDTKGLSTSEFMDYIADIQQWAAEFLSIVIPDPEQQSSFNFKNNNNGKTN